MRRRIRLALLLFVAALLAIPALASDFLIIPGQGIGSVALGMSRQTVHQLLRAPQMTRRLHDGTVEDSWITLISKPQQYRYSEDTRQWKYYFVNIYYSKGQVAQVEVNSPLFKTAKGLSTNRPAVAFRKQYHPYQSSNRKTGEPLLYGGRDRGGYPGYKHYITVEDNTRHGIAWRYGSWGDLAPDPDPDVQEIIIVHPCGRRVIREPDAGNRFVLTSRDVGLTASN